jgi:hypothetical protein
MKKQLLVLMTCLAGGLLASPASASTHKPQLEITVGVDGVVEVAFPKGVPSVDVELIIFSGPNEPAFALAPDLVASVGGSDHAFFVLPAAARGDWLIMEALFDTPEPSMGAQRRWRTVAYANCAGGQCKRSDSTEWELAHGLLRRVVDADGTVTLEADLVRVSE